MKFTIEVEMKDRWVSTFISMLKYMEYLGNIGSSKCITIYSDGDGDFRPKFKFKGIVGKHLNSDKIKFKESKNGDRFYDAG